MQRVLRPSALVLPGLTWSAVYDGAVTVITVRPTSDARLCPGCGAGSGRIHRRYRRRLTDLRWQGGPVRLVIVARRFRRIAVMCGRYIFTERGSWARRTGRLDQLSITLGLQ